MQRSQRAGFTLIELLVVIAIIGLLSAIVLASLNTARAGARDARRLEDLRQIRYALELYANDHNGLYPWTNGNFIWVSGSHPNTGSNGWIPNLAPTYISVLPNDPVSGDFYEYEGGDGSAAGSVNYKVTAPCEAYTASNSPLPNPQTAHAQVGDVTQCMTIYSQNASAAYPSGTTCTPSNPAGLGATCW